MRNPFGSALWRNSAFVRVWTASTVSVFGSLITRMALPLAAILILGTDALGIALLRGLELGATLLVGLVAGAWVDRLRRRGAWRATAIAASFNMFSKSAPENPGSDLT